MKALLIALALLALYAVPAAAQDDQNCLDFESQAAAQQHLRDEPSDLDGLDGPVGPTGAGIIGVACDSYIGDYEDPAEDLTPVGTEPPIEPTEEPPTIEPTAAPEETPMPEATKEMPDGMGNNGGGGLATGASVPWGSLGLAASGLLAAGYAVLRRR